MFSNVDHKALAALLHGQGCANSLKTLLDNHEITSVLIEPLINTILDSFSLALSFVDSPSPPPHHESSSQNMAGLVLQRSSKKRICGIHVIKNYRDESPTPRPDDGFTWRKYGQKTIKTSVHQRSYYRCGYAKEHNCNATKRVQMIQDCPPVYRTTYMGQHTCKAIPVYDDTYGSEMIQFDQVVSESVMPRFTSTDNEAFNIKDEATDHTMNQECDINDFLVDYEPNEFPSFSYEDSVFF
ncbi:PREDICTED: probable WRKY transcription factor 64 [Camelina sativa]|uniref:Probable WRKY transcription factor 64 n=1 Tax=Camelina sativa TaxID=90675 RepID=A0ABM0Z7G4_CAMSA|nr:PREDICTED: probable WRKY transcription factor 64 [Camelina sativa]